MKVGSVLQNRTHMFWSYPKSYGFSQHPAACPCIVQMVTGGQSVIPGGLEVLLSWWPTFPRTRLAVAHLRCGWIQMFSFVFLISLLLCSHVISSYPSLTLQGRIIVEWLTREVNTSIEMMEHKVSGTKENLFVIPQSKGILYTHWSEGSSRRESESLGTRVIGGHW